MTDSVEEVLDGMDEHDLRLGTLTHRVSQLQLRLDKAEHTIRLLAQQYRTPGWDEADDGEEGP